MKSQLSRLWAHRNHPDLKELVRGAIRGTLNTLRNKRECRCAVCGAPVNKERADLYRALLKPIECQLCAQRARIPILKETVNSYGMICTQRVEMI